MTFEKIIQDLQIKSLEVELAAAQERLRKAAIEAETAQLMQDYTRECVKNERNPLN